MTWWHFILALAIVWNLAPIVVVWCLPVPTRHKLGAARCFLEAAAKGVVDIIPNITAPVVVPVALLFCKWESEKLPRFFWWWGTVCPHLHRTRWKTRPKCAPKTTGSRATTRAAS